MVYILFGYHYALDNNAEYVFQTDCDGRTVSCEVWNFWKLRNNYSAIIGHRENRQDGFLRICVANVLKLTIKLIFDINVEDTNTPFRIIKSDILRKYLRHIPDKFSLSNVLLAILLVRAKEDVKFIPITFKPRQT